MKVRPSRASAGPGEGAARGVGAGRAARLALAAAPALVALAVVATDLPALGLGFAWDDLPYVRTSPALGGGAGGLLRALRCDLYAFASPPDAPSGYWRPVATLSFWLDSRFGQGPAALHAGSVILQAASAALLVLLLRRRLGGGAAAGVAGALAALLWAVHPASVEAVAWVSCRYDLLATLFALALLLLPWAPGYRRAGLHGLLFLCGLLSKEGFAAMAAVVLADDLAARRPARAAAPRWCAVAVALATWWALRSALHIAPMGAPTPGEGGLRILGAFAAYLGRAVAPLPLTISHPAAEAGQAILLAAAGAAVALALVALAWKRRDLAPAAALFLAPLVPAGLASGITGQLPERYLHLPSAGLAWLLAAGIAAALRRAPASGRALAASTAVLALGSMAAVRARLPAWEDDASLFASAAAVDPGDPLANLYLGIAAGRAGRLDESQRRLALAASRAPRSARAANALAWARLRSGDAAGALAEAGRAVALSPAWPEARLNLASAHHLAGEHAAELTEASRAVALSPGFREARITRALARCELERSAACEADLASMEAEGVLGGADALVAGVEAALRRGDGPLARARLGRLREVAPSDPRLPVLERALLRQR